MIYCKDLIVFQAFYNLFVPILSPSACDERNTSVVMIDNKEDKGAGIVQN